MATQVLVCGDVRGRLGRLYQRVTAVNKAHGPFAFVVCVGEFFPDAAERCAAAPPRLSTARGPAAASCQLP